MSLTNDEIDKIRELRKRKYSYAKIAEILGRDVSTIYRHSRTELEDLICPHCGKVFFEGRYFKEKLIEKIKRECLR